MKKFMVEILAVPVVDGHECGQFNFTGVGEADTAYSAVLNCSVHFYPALADFLDDCDVVTKTDDVKLFVKSVREVKSF